MTRRTKHQKKIRNTEWHRIDAGHYARRLPDGTDQVVRCLASHRWSDPSGGEHCSMTTAMDECDRIADGGQ